MLQSKYIKHALVNSKFRFDVESFDLKFELKFGNSNESTNFPLKLQLEVIVSCLIKQSRQNPIEIESEFFHSLGNPKGGTLDHFFCASHIRHNIPYGNFQAINSVSSSGHFPANVFHELTQITAALKRMTFVLFCSV